MKTNNHLKISFVAIVFSLILFNSCSKEEVTPEIKGCINKFLATDTNLKFGARYYQPTYIVEVGINFTPLKNGEITHLGIRMGDPGSYPITVYSSLSWTNAKIPYAQKMIEQTTYNKWVYEEIEPLEVIKDKNYYITVSCPVNKNFNRITEVTYPIIYKDIKVIGAVKHYLNENDNYFVGIDGNGNPMNYLEGIPDFVFVAD